MILQIKYLTKFDLYGLNEKVSSQHNTIETVQSISIKIPSSLQTLIPITVGPPVLYIEVPKAFTFVTTKRKDARGSKDVHLGQYWPSCNVIVYD
jgi:hypothetical protein